MDSLIRWMGHHNRLNNFQLLMSSSFSLKITNNSWIINLFIFTVIIPDAGSSIANQLLFHMSFPSFSSLGRSEIDERSTSSPPLPHMRLFLRRLHDESLWLLKIFIKRVAGEDARLNVRWNWNTLFHHLLKKIFRIRKLFLVPCKNTSFLFIL